MSDEVHNVIGEATAYPMRGSVDDTIEMYRVQRDQQRARARNAVAKVKRLIEVRVHGSPVVLQGRWGVWIDDAEWERAIHDD